MRAHTVSNLCTLSGLLRSQLKTRTPSTNVFPSQFLLLKPNCNLSGLNFTCASSQGDSADEDEDAVQLSALLHPTQDKRSGLEDVDDDGKGKPEDVISWIPDMSHGNLSLCQKVTAHERKQTRIFKYTYDDFFGRLIKLCIKKARATDNEVIAVREMSKVFHLFKSMRDLGFQLKETTYGPILQYLIDMGLVQEFELFSDFIRAENPTSASRLGYYEMLLWLRVDNEEMIRNICEYITVEDSKDTFALRESYLMALCESDRKMQILDLLPSSSSYEKLILHCCRLEKIDAALDFVEKMCEAGFSLSTEMLQAILKL